MFKLRRFFNQNKSLIITIIIIILAVFIGLRLLNYFTKIQNEQNKQEYENININNTYNRDYEIISGETKDENIYFLETDVIKNFIDYCNERNYEEAYNMLTQNCKEIIFPNLETFINEYAEKIFNEKRDYNVQAWKANIYRVKYTKDLLANGKTTDSDFIEDYISVNGEKLNINNYLGTNTIKSNEEKANVTIDVQKIDYYMDYIDIKLKIKNERKTSIMLNDRDNSENIYVEDDGELKYTAFLHELTDEEFIIGAGQEKEISIRFDIPYNKSGDLKSLNMMNMIADYEQYQSTENSRLIQFNIEL